MSAEDIAAGDEPGERVSFRVEERPGPRIKGADELARGVSKQRGVRSSGWTRGALRIDLAAGKDLVTLEHGFDGEDMALRNPEAFRVFIDDNEVTFGVEATEQSDGIMREAVVQGGEPFEGVSIVEVIENMDIATERVEELAGGDIPGAVVPGFLLPAGATGEDLFVFRVGEFIVVNAGGDEARGGFRAALKGDDESMVIPKVPDAAGVGGGVDAGAPVGKLRVEG